MTVPTRDLVETGLHWLGAVPASWRVTPLRHLVDFRSGGTPSKEREDFWGGGIPWASAKDLKSDVLHDTIDHLDEAAISLGNVQLLPKQTVVVLVRGMMLAKTFPVVRLAKPMAINQDLKGLLPRPGMDPGFLAWALRGTARATLDRLDEAGHGTKALRMDAWVSMQLAVPPRAEQAAIAAFLDRETGKIDALVEAQTRLIELLKENRQAVISHAVTKGLDTAAPMKDSGVEWLGQVPAHWDIRKFTQVIGVQEGPGIMAVDFMDDGIPLLRVAGAQGRWASLVGCNFLDPSKVASRWEHFRLNEGDLVISGSASTGTVCEVGPDTVGAVPYTGLMRITPVQRVTMKDYVRALVSSAMFFVQIDQLKAGATIQHFGPTHLARMIATVPPLEEQVEIAAFVDARSGEYAALLTEAEAAIELLKERRAALISAAVTGKIDARGLAPEQAEAA